MTRPLRILVNAIPAANPVTGIGRYVLELYAALGAIAGDDVDVRYFDGRGISREPPSGPRDMKRFSRMGTLFWKLPLAVSLPIRLAVHRRRERLFGELSRGFDLYHETAFFPFAPAPGVRVVQTIHDLSLQLHPEWHPAERVAYAARYFAPRLAWSSQILCVSEFTKSELARFDPAAGGRATVTRLAADARFTVASPAQQAGARQRYGLPERYVFFVGSGDPRKNTRVLAELVKRGRLRCPIVSAGWSGWSPADKGDGVRALGYVPDADLPALFSGAIAFVFPSLYEGFGLPVLEAMACGCPVVVPRAHTMPEIAGDAGVFYGAPGDVEGLEAALEGLIANPAQRERHAALGLEQARRFDWKTTARGTLEVFQKALAADVPAALRERGR